jgi:hypothetical protein
MTYDEKKTLVHDIAKSVYDSCHTPIVMDVYGSAIDMLGAAINADLAASREQEKMLAEALKKASSMVRFYRGGGVDTMSLPILDDELSAALSVYEAHNPETATVPGTAPDELERLR